MTPREKAFLKGGRAPNQGIGSNPNRYAVKPAATNPMSFSKGTVWNGPQSLNEQFSKLGPKYITKNPDGSYSKTGNQPQRLLNSQPVKKAVGGYFNFRKMLAPWEMLMYPGTAHAPSEEEMGFAPQPTVWYNEGPTGQYRRQDGN